MVEVYAAGDQPLESRVEIQQRFVEFFQDAFGPRNSTERFACEALVAAVITMVTARLAARDVEGLRGLQAAHRPRPGRHHGPLARPHCRREAPTDAEQMTPDHEVAIIGAGLGGLGMAIALRRGGIDDFVVLERAGDLGGT